jgi:hypothetical protein
VRGGTAKFKCEADADCSANCSASASAKAECDPPSLSISYDVAGNASAEAQLQIEAAVASLRANLPALIVVLKARGAAFAGGIEATVDAGANLSATAGDFSAKASAACSDRRRGGKSFRELRRHAGCKREGDRRRGREVSQ